MAKGYSGNKWSHGSFHQIINQIPPHEIFISGFAGSCAVAKNKLGSHVADFVCEISSKVIQEYWNRYRVVTPDEMISCIADRNNFPADNIIHDHAVDNNCGSGNFLELAKSELSTVVTYRHQKSEVTTGSMVPGFVVNSDFVQILRSCNHLLSMDDFIYLDPPYDFSVRKGQRDLYEHELTREQHEEIIQLVLDSKCKVAISHYRGELYDQLLQHGWRVIEWQVMTHGGKKMEALYMNYPEPLELHQYNFLGKNRTDRQRIKRKKQRWTEKLKGMNSTERYAILSAIDDLK